MAEVPYLDKAGLKSIFLLHMMW